MHLKSTNYFIILLQSLMKEYIFDEHHNLPDFSSVGIGKFIFDFSSVGKFYNLTILQ